MGIYKDLKNKNKSGFSYSIMIILYLILSFIGQSLVGEFYSQGSFNYIIICSLFPVIAIFLVILFNKIALKQQFLEITRIQKFNALYLLLSPLLSVAMFLGLGFLNTSIANFFIKLGLNVSSTQIAIENVKQLVFYIVFLAILPAIVEEMFFRGLIIEKLKNCSICSICVFSAIIFSLYHCSVAQLVYQLIYGFSLAILSIKAKSIIPAVLSHFINNFVIILFIYINYNIDLSNIIFIVIGLICLAVFYVIIFAFNKGEKSKGEKIKIGSAYLFASFGIILTLILIVMGLFK